MLLILAAVVTLAVQEPQNSVLYLRGDLVEIARAADEHPLPLTRVIAVAGDRVEADSRQLRVNGQPVEGMSREFLAQFAEPWTEVVPKGHYMVLGETMQRDAGNVGTIRYHGLIPAEKIARRVTR